MKVDEPAPAETQREETTTPTPNKRAATSETLSNLSRVTPAQLQFVNFPPDSRFQPVRPIGRGGGGIVMLLDKEEGKDVTWIEPFGAPAPAPAPASAEAAPAATSTGEEAAPPPPVQVSWLNPILNLELTDHIYFDSITLIPNELG